MDSLGYTVVWVLTSTKIRMQNSPPTSPDSLGILDYHRKEFFHLLPRKSKPGWQANWRGEGEMNQVSSTSMGGLFSPSRVAFTSSWVLESSSSLFTLSPEQTFGFLFILISHRILLWVKTVKCIISALKFLIAI